MIPINLLKVILPIFVSFIVGGLITSPLTTFFYKQKLWKKVARQVDNPDPVSAAFMKVHNDKDEVRTPRTGGIIIWLSAFITVLFFVALAFFWPENALYAKLNFFSRNQTLLPLFGLLAGALIGLFEDWLEIRPQSDTTHGLSSKYLIAIVVVIGAIAGWWFYCKLGITDLRVPFIAARLSLGWLIVPAAVLVTLGTFSSRVIDGIDGLAGGVMATIFTAYSFIAYTQNQLDIAAFAAVITGGILVFLWFNIPPARFYMGETGMLALTVTLAIIAFLTDTVLLLPIIALPLVVTSLSSALQIASKKYFGKKIFRVAPIHHHFEVLGWSRPKITMRYWIISVMCALIGIIISFFG
jgi:phospho-N-acetylmuramoyl-pentapeptide-transferase